MHAAAGYHYSPCLQIHYHTTRVLLTVQIVLIPAFASHFSSTRVHFAILDEVLLLSAKGLGVFFSSLHGSEVKMWVTSPLGKLKKEILISWRKGPSKLKIYAVELGS